MKVKKIAEMYEKGIITQGELVCRFFEDITEETIGDFLILSEEHQKAIEERTARLPADDDDKGWNETVHIAGIVATVVYDREAHEKRKQEEKDSYRRGVKIFREWKEKCLKINLTWRFY